MGSGFAIKTTTLPVALLTHHCAQILLMLAKPTSTSPQTMAVELQLAAPQ